MPERLSCPPYSGWYVGRKTCPQVSDQSVGSRRMGWTGGLSVSICEELEKQTDTKKEAYSPTHVPWLSENLPLEISTPILHRSAPAMPTTRPNSLSPFLALTQEIGAIGPLSIIQCLSRYWSPHVMSLLQDPSPSQDPHLSSQEHLPSS